MSQINDPNIVLNNLSDKIKICLSKSEYTKKPNKTNIMKPRKDWVTKAIMISSKTKEKLYKIWKKDPTNDRKRAGYKKFTNILKDILNKAKESYDKKLVESNMNNIKSMWNDINQKIGKNSKKKNNINYIIENNKKILDSKEIAEHFNKYFCNISKKLSDKIRPPINEEIKLPSMNSKSIFFQPTNQNEIKNIINNLENKNGENDNINAKTFKTLVELLVDPLTHISNVCVDEAIWPDALKSTDVIPLHKSKEKHIANNYRLISLISNIAKVLEKIIHKRVITFINKCDILAKNQYGFRKNRSKVNQKLSILKTIKYYLINYTITVLEEVPIIS